MRISNTWRRLAEYVDRLEIDETNWRTVNQRKNIQRWGTQDRNFNDPTAMIRQKRQAALAAQPPDMTPLPGGMALPVGQDRPNQGNPLFDPPIMRKRRGEEDL